MAECCSREQMRQNCPTSGDLEPTTMYKMPTKNQSVEDYIKKKIDNQKKKTHKEEVKVFTSKNSGPVVSNKEETPNPRKLLQNILPVSLTPPDTNQRKFTVHKDDPQRIIINKWGDTSPQNSEKIISATTNVFAQYQKQLIVPTNQMLEVQITPTSALFIG